MKVERPVIEPTVGRVVWYTPRVDDTLYRYSDPGQKFAAIIAYVWGDGSVSLAVFDDDGVATNRTNVPLFQDGDTLPAGGDYAEWMPEKNGRNIREFVAWYPNLGVVIKTDTGYDILTSEDGLVWSPRTNPK